MARLSAPAADKRVRLNVVAAVEIQTASSLPITAARNARRRTGRATRRSVRQSRGPALCLPHGWTSIGAQNAALRKVGTLESWSSSRGILRRRAGALICLL